MYTDIGWRNNEAVQRQGRKVIEKLNAKGLGNLAASYEDALHTCDTLMKAANIVANR